MELIIGKAILALTSIIVAILNKNKIADLINFIKSTKHNKYVFDKIVDSSTSDKIIKELCEHYNMDRSILYYFHNGKYAVNGYGFYHFSCLSEYFDPNKLVGKKKDQQNMPIGSLANFFVHYRDEGMVMCHDIEEYTGSIQDMRFVLESLNVKSTYSNIIKDKTGKFVGVLVLNSETECRKIEDFEEFNFACKELGRLMTN